MKKKIELFISMCFPSRIKKILFRIWRKYDLDFYLSSKGSNSVDLFQKRFLWNDFNKTIKSIISRFGKHQLIYLLTDRDCFIQNKRVRVLNENDLLFLEKKEDYPIICAFDSDEKLIKTLNAIKDKPNIYYYAPYRYLPTARYFHKNDLAKKVLIQDYNLRRGKFDLSDFENIIQCIEITREVKGDYVEIGVYKGDSAHVALNYMNEKNIKRNSYFFDLYEGFVNTSSQQSKDASWLNTHIDSSLSFVVEYLKRFDNCVIQKLDIIEQELPIQIKKIALCNIDVDLYEAVKMALIKVSPKIESGGIIILEDQGHTPYLAGALLATSEFLSSDNGKFYIPVHMISGQLLLIRK